MRTIFDEKAESLAHKCQIYMSSDDFHQKVLGSAAAQRFTMSPEMKLFELLMKELERWCTGEDVKFEVEEIHSKIKYFSQEANAFLQNFMEQLTDQPVESFITPFDATWFVDGFLEAFPKAVSFHVVTFSKVSWWFSTKSKREKNVKQKFEKLLNECSASLISIFKNVIVLFFSEKINRIIENLLRQCDFVETIHHHCKGGSKMQEVVLSKLKTIIDDLHNISVRLTQVQMTIYTGV